VLFFPKCFNEIWLVGTWSSALSSTRQVSWDWLCLSRRLRSLLEQLSFSFWLFTWTESQGSYILDTGANPTQLPGQDIRCCLLGSKYENGEEGKRKKSAKKGKKKSLREYGKIITCSNSEITVGNRRIVIGE
jgi:hypothetical protein